MEQVRREQMMGELKKDGIRGVMSEATERETLKGIGQRASREAEPALEPCPLSHYVHAGLRAHKTGLDPRIVCLDCGLTLRAPDWIKVYERWQSRSRVSADRAGAMVDGISRADAIRILQEARESGTFDLRGLIAELKGLPTVAGPQRCLKCGHYNEVDPRGRCISTYYDAAGSLVYCGCRCVLSATASPAVPRDEAAGWLPIESAPKDGRTILACDGGYVVTVAWRYDDCWGGVWGSEDYIQDGSIDDTALIARNLTHWMPLPAPPVTNP